MIFQERKVESGYHYKCEDIFGEVEITAPEQLDKDTLDDLIVFLLEQKTSAELLTGSVKIEAGTVAYTFKRRPIWEDLDPEPCENSPTSTQRPENGFIVRTVWTLLMLPEKTINWCRKFVGAFLEAWKNVRK